MNDVCGRICVCVKFMKFSFSASIFSLELWEIYKKNFELGKSIFFCYFWWLKIILSTKGLECDLFLNQFWKIIL